jgi:hypothetical protein
MKLMSIALVASVAVAGQVQAQTPPPAPAASQPAPSDSSSGGSISRACKKEIKQLCGRAHGQEMQGCIKDNLDMNKFSADCKSELAKQPAKPSS